MQLRDSFEQTKIYYFENSKLKYSETFNSKVGETSINLEIIPASQILDSKLISKPSIHIEQTSAEPTVSQFHEQGQATMQQPKPAVITINYKLLSETK